MYAKVYGASCLGIDGYIVTVEVDISKGLPYFEIVGLPTASVREARERVRAAITNSGFIFPMMRIVVNLAPADRKKMGCGLDVAIVIGILLASKQLKDTSLENTVFIGEVSLKGHIGPTTGVLAMALMAAKNKCKFLYVACENVKEAQLSGTPFVIGVHDIAECVKILQGTEKAKEGSSVNVEAMEASSNMDMSEVQGQRLAKRALEIAAAGGHNLMLVGPPGAGKTMLAQRMTTILPALTKEEAIEVTKIYSVAGLLKEGNIIKTRPFRQPHHTITAAGMIGGGTVPKPGEVTLSHHGILFLDELPEFSRYVLDVLRQPIEEGQVHVSRAHGTYVYPADFSLVVAMNPCPCGYLGDDEHECYCSDGDLLRYKRKISGPLLDRIDLFVTVKRPCFDELALQTESESSAVILQRVLAARERQMMRFGHTSIKVNGAMTHSMIVQYCPISKEANNLLKQAFQTFGLSARSYDRLLRVAQTITDLAGETTIGPSAMAEALSFRNHKIGG